MLSSGDIYNDLLIAAAKIAAEQVVNLVEGDEVRVRVGGGFFTGEVLETSPEGILVKGKPFPNGKLFPYSVVTSLAEERKAEAERRRLEEEEALRLAEAERPRSPEERYAERKWKELEGVSPDSLAVFAQYVNGNRGQVRVHYGPRGQNVAAYLFAEAGVVNTLMPYTPGSRGGTTQMSGVSGEVQFQKPANFNPNDIPVAEYADLGTRIVVYSTALSFELIKRGVKYVGLQEEEDLP